MLLDSSRIYIHKKINNKQDQIFRDRFLFTSQKELKKLWLNAVNFKDVEENLIDGYIVFKITKTSNTFKVIEYEY